MAPEGYCNEKRAERDAQFAEFWRGLAQVIKTWIAEDRLAKARWN